MRWELTLTAYCCWRTRLACWLEAKSSSRRSPKSLTSWVSPNRDTIFCRARWEAWDRPEFCTGGSEIYTHVSLQQATFG